MKTQLSTKILVLVLSLSIVACGPLPTPNLATATPTVTPSATITPTPTTPDPFRELTAIVEETQRAEQRSTAIAQLTEKANAEATQQFLFVLQTVQADLEATRIYEQAQQQVATEQSLNAEATAQIVISSQQTATTDANNQGVAQVLNFYNNLPNLPVSFSDTFEDSKNGWSPKSGNGYSVSMKGDVLTVNFSDAAYSPFIWTCDNCGSFNNFSYQIDIKTPKDAPRIVSGILFGSPVRLDQQPFQESYALSIYSSGAVLLERLSITGRDNIELWDHRQDLITPDGEFHTLQVIAVDGYAAVYVDDKLVGDVIKLDYPNAGYIGIVSQSTNVDVIYDNLKIVALP